MSKTAVTRLFIGSIIAVVAGAILAIAAVAIAIGSNVFVMSGNDVTGVRSTGLAWTLVGLAIVGGLAIAGGLISGLVSWIGALLNTWQVESKAWFVGLLLLGIFNFGFVAMIAYLIAGPDGTTEATRRTALAPAAA